MTLDVRAVRYGPEAFDALADVVQRAKGGDPLRPVTVVVPKGTVGLATRRRLAAGPGGICNVRHVTLARLAEDVALPALTRVGGRPLTPVLVHEAVRAVLAARTGGLLVGVRDQPATVRALARTFGELHGASSGTLLALAALSPRAAEVVEVVRGVRALLAGRFTAADLLRAAAAEVAPAEAGAPPDAGAGGAGALPPGTGAVVVHLPLRLANPEAAFVRAMAEVTEVTVLVGTTGRPAPDQLARSMVELLGATPVYLGLVDPAAAARPPAGTDGAGPGAGTPGPDAGTPGSRDGTPGLATRVWAAPSADAEVLVAVRELLALQADGTPLERMALLHSGRAPYGRLVRDTLAVAGVPWNGPSARPLSATVAGRTLLGYLELAEQGWQREDVIGWLAAAPVRHAGAPAPVAAWDLVSSEARVVAGLAEWRDRLADHGVALRRRAAWLEEGPTDDEDGATTAAGLRRDAATGEELWRFVEQLADRLGTPPEDWEGWGGWCRRLLDDLLGGPLARTEWPPEEIAALEAVADVLQGLASLDEIGRRPGLADVRAVLQGELEATAPQTSRFGQGIFSGRVADAVGLDLDVVWVLGMTDGSFPSSAADDVLVPDRERERVASAAEVPRRGARRLEEERDLLAALSAPAVRILSYPMGDQRQGGALRPARPLLDALGALAGGRRLYARDLPLVGAAAAAAGDRFVVVPSYASAAAGTVGTGGTPMGAADWDLRELTRWVLRERRAPGRHFLAAEDPVLARGLALRHGRRRRTVTRYDGGVGDLTAPLVAGELQTSATTLEHYARCPRRFLFGEVLGLSARERPEEVLRISPLDRGVAVHRILEGLVGAELLRTAGAVDGGSAGTDPGSPGTAAPVGSETDGVVPPADEARATEAALVRLADGVFAELEGQRRTGRHALWQIDRAAILASLRRFVARDREYRQDLGAVPEAVEARFGEGDVPPVDVDLGGGRRVAFRGRIDRIDRTVAGGLSVLDYKSGHANGDPDGPLDDPLAGGTRLQLAVYGLAARRRYRPEGTVRAGYWYLGGDGALSWCEVTDDLEGELGDVLRTVADAIGRGAFPGRPGADHHRSRGANCATCPFDPVCPADRRREWERKRGDPWIADYVAMAEPGLGVPATGRATEPSP